MHTGLLLGCNPTTKERLRLAAPGMLQGMYVPGVTGSGKSTLLLTIALDLARSGKGFLLVDPHGGLVSDFLDLADVNPSCIVLLDPLASFAKGNAFGLNLLECNPKDAFDVQLTVDSFVHVFEKIWGYGATRQSWGERMENLLRIIAYTLCYTHHLAPTNCLWTMADIPRLMADTPFRGKLIDALPTPIKQLVIPFWNQYAELDARTVSLFAEWTSPVTNKVSRFLTNLPVFFTVAQSRSTLDFSAYLESPPIILVRLPQLDEDVVSLIGSIILTKVVKAMYQRVSRTPFTVLLDEYHRFATSDVDRLQTEGRKFGIATVVTHQARSQLDHNQLGSSLQVPNVVSFALSPPDAEDLAPLFTQDEENVEVYVFDPLRYINTHGHPNPHVSEVVRSVTAGMQAKELIETPHSQEEILPSPMFISPRAEHLGNVERTQRRNPSSEEFAFLKSEMEDAYDAVRRYLHDRMSGLLSDPEGGSYHRVCMLFNFPIRNHPPLDPKYDYSKKLIFRSFMEAIQELGTILAEEPIKETFGPRQSPADRLERAARLLRSQPNFQATARLMVDDRPLIVPLMTIYEPSVSSTRFDSTSLLVSPLYRDHDAILHEVNLRTSTKLSPDGKLSRVSKGEN